MRLSKCRIWIALATVALLLAVIGVPASADGIRAQRERAEASMLVTGEIWVTPTGHVGGFTLDKPDELPAPVKSLVAKAIQQWRFEPVRLDGRAVNAKARMNLRVVARRSTTEKDSATIRIGSTYFGDMKSAQGIEMHARRTPVYPQMAINARAGGMVYVLAELAPDGTVKRLAVEQVNLTSAGPERVVKRIREALGKASIEAVKDWTFSSATSRPDQFVRVPLNFQINDTHHSTRRYGKWEGYIPGPRELVPWATEAQLANGVDALPAGSAASAKQALTLLDKSS